MSTPNFSALRVVAERLDELGLKYAFLGGSIVNLLLDNPAFSPVRPTDDVDVVLEVVTALRYSKVEARLRALGFSHDDREGAPRCRWILKGLTVDIMPTRGDELGLNTAWFEEALASAHKQIIDHIALNIVSPAGFLATKYVAFVDRGKGDYYASHDLEDFITVVDGRADIVVDVDRAPTSLRQYLIKSVQQLLAHGAFGEALTGHLPPDEASQQRLTALKAKLHAIANLG